MVLSQFSPEHGKKHLGDFFDFPKDVYSLGRLDEDSEGLLFLTNDRELKTLAMNSDMKVPKEYLVFVEGEMLPLEMNELRNGVEISVKGTLFKTAPAIVEKVENPIVHDRIPPVQKPGEWVQITIHEGKFRQVRKMTASVSHPTLRLIRTAYGGIKLGNMKPGDCIMLSKKAAYSKILG